MSPEDCLKFFEAMPRLGKAVSSLNATVEPLVDVPLLGFQVRRHDVQRFFYWIVLKCYGNPSLDWPAHGHAVEGVRL